MDDGYCQYCEVRLLLLDLNITLSALMTSECLHGQYIYVCDAKTLTDCSLIN